MTAEHPNVPLSIAMIWEWENIKFGGHPGWQGRCRLWESRG